MSNPERRLRCHRSSQNSCRSCIRLICMCIPSCRPRFSWCSRAAPPDFSCSPADKNAHTDNTMRCCHAHADNTIQCYVRVHFYLVHCPFMQIRLHHVSICSAHRLELHLYCEHHTPSMRSSKDCLAQRHQRIRSCMNSQRSLCVQEEISVQRSSESGSAFTGFINQTSSSSSRRSSRNNGSSSGSSVPARRSSVPFFAIRVRHGLQAEHEQNRA